jgi:predicted PurR-regulated permease PerM
MGSTLAAITLAVVLIVVVALVIYLLRIIVALRGASRNLYQLAGGLDQIVKDTQPLPDKLTTINGALSQLLNSLLQVEGHLSSVAKLFKQP